MGLAALGVHGASCPVRTGLPGPTDAGRSPAQNHPVGAAPIVSIAALARGSFTT
jgi:hypothetical protein